MAKTYEMCLNMTDGTKRTAQFTVPTPTAAEIGLGNVNNTSDANKPISNAQAEVNAHTGARIDLVEAHAGSKNNPHGVTASQVGARPDTWMPSASDVGAVAKTLLKSLAYSQTDENGNVSTNGLTSYPTTPGVFRVIGPITGLPNGVLGYGSLVIFDGGSYLLHIYQDASGHLYWARTSDGVKVPTAANWNHFFDSADVIPVANGGTGGTDEWTAKSNLGLIYFKTYLFENSNSPLTTIQNNYHLIANSACVIYCVCGGTHYTLFGFKLDNYCAFIEVDYGTSDIYKYRNYNGTWTQHTYRSS